MPRVPTANLSTNVLEKQVIGNKADAAVSLPSDTASIIAYLKSLCGVAGLGDRPVNGPTYYVDYDLGADTNDGFSPQAPLKLLSAAITKVLAFQSAATNVYTRCRIFLMGSSTCQPALTVLPNYTDIIGVGANPHGDGVGIARIGTGTGDGVTNSATKRGLYFKNIQFLGGDGDSAFKVASGGNLLRSTFEDCVFGDSAAVTATAMNAGLETAATVAGCVFRRCFFGMGNVAVWPLYGIYAGAQFSQNVIEDCNIQGVTAGIYIAAGGHGVHTIIRNNVIGDFGGGCLKGIDDDSTGGYFTLAGNMIMATDAIEMTARATDRIVGNICTQGTVGSRATISEGNLLVRTT